MDKLSHLLAVKSHALELAQVTIDAQAVKQVSKALTHNGVKELLLKENRLTNRCTRELVKAIKGSKCLSMISVVENNLSPRDAELFADVLKHNKTLTSLDLSNNQLGNNGAWTLAQALQENDTLTALFLAHNGISNKGAKALASALQEHTSLRTLCLKGNNVSNGGVRFLVKALEHNDTLVTLTLTGNNLGGSAIARIESLLQKQDEDEFLLSDEERAVIEDYVRSRCAAETTFARARAEVITGRALLGLKEELETRAQAYFAVGEEKGMIERFKRVARSKEEYLRCQERIVAPDAAGILSDLVDSRDAAKEQLRAAASAVQNDGSAVDAHRALLEERSSSITAAIGTLERLSASHRSSDGETSSQEEHNNDEHEVREDSKDGYVELELAVEELNAAEVKTRARVVKEREDHLWRVQNSETVQVNKEGAEFCCLVDEKVATAQLVIELDTMRHRLHTLSTQLFRETLSEYEKIGQVVQRQLKDAIEREGKLPMYLAFAEQVTSWTYPSTTYLKQAESAKSEALRKLRYTERLMPATLILAELAEEDGLKDQAEASRKAYAQHQADAQAAARERKEASAAMQAEMLLLLKACRCYPELFIECRCLAAVQAAPSLVLGLCIDDYHIVKTLPNNNQGSGIDVLLCHKRRHDNAESPDASEHDSCILKRYKLAMEEGVAEKDSHRLLEELIGLERAQSPFVAAAKAMFFSNDGEEAYVEFEYFGGGNLRQWIANSGQLGDRAIQSLLTQALTGLRAIHSAGIVHRGLGFCSLYVSADGSRCVVGDFFPPRESNETRPLVPETELTMESDIFAFGLLAFDALFPKAEGGPDRRPSVAAMCEGERLLIPSHPNEGLRQVLGRMLNLNPKKRPTAAEALKLSCFREQEEDDDSEDVLWGEAQSCHVAKCCRGRPIGLTLADGLACREGQHFICTQDLESHVKEFCSVRNQEQQQHTNGVVTCSYEGCDGLFECSVLIHKLSPSVLGAVLAMEERTLEAKFAREQAALYQKRLDEDIARLEKEGVVAMHARKIQEEVLVLSCPRCHAAFAEFSGCFALECDRCSCRFCAACLQDCGNDAHTHVRICPARENRDGFGFVGEFNIIHKKRRIRLVKEYLDNLSEVLRTEVQQAIQKDLDDLGIDIAAA